ncbi:MAG: hypothetical protein ACR5K9_07630 [Wolbachia sp.]
MLDELEEEQVIEDILDIIEEKGVVINKFRSVKEVEEYLKQEADNWYSKQLTRIQSEHNYASSPLTNVTSYGHSELSDEGYISPCEEVVEPNPSGKIYNLRGIKKLKEGNCICCK